MKKMGLLYIIFLLSFGNVLASDTPSTATSTLSEETTNAHDTNSIGTKTDSAPPMSTATSSEEAGSCPVSLIFPGDVHVREVFTQFRDVVLAGNERGITYARLYYIHSPEITLIILTDSAIKTHAQKIISDIIPIAAERLKKGAASLPQQLLDDMDSLINEIARSASPSLKDVLRMTKSDIIKKNVFEELKIGIIQ